MGRKVFAELDKLTFNRIKRSKNINGMIDENKFFNGLNEGDSVIFSCDNRKIEAYLRAIKIYNSMGEYLKENDSVGVLEINSKSPVDFLSIMTSMKNEGRSVTKRVRIFEVDYHPYGDDDDEEEEDDENTGGSLESFIKNLLENRT
jgi:hypothetical protein